MRSEECNNYSKFNNLNKYLADKVNENYSEYEMEIVDITSNDFSIVILANLYEMVIKNSKEVRDESKFIQRVWVNKLDNIMSVSYDSVYVSQQQFRALELNLLRDMELVKLF